MKNAIFMALILGMLLLAGCAGLESISQGGSGNSGYSGGSNYNRPSMMPASASRGAVADFAASPEPSSAPASSQKLIKTANAEVEVPIGTLQDRYSKFKASILGQGGQIVSSDYSETESTKQYNVQVKIRPENFESLAGLLQGIGAVKSMSSNVNDVSDQYVDLQTRIRNLELQRGRLQDLYNRSANLSDLLQLEQELMRVQTEIEMYQNQKLNMDRQIGMSGVWVRIFEQAPAADSSVLKPLGDVFNVFLGALVAAILLAAGLLGFAIPGLVVLGILYLLYQRFWPYWPKKPKAGKK